ncbi:MAG: SDR family oxidoreductase [Alphaproteobacteria bacterium]|nr:SDR family oxidoreductase [Alphaproteobacteria bacterium]
MAELQKIALVTGGAQGIGLACAQALSADGAQVAVADINGDGAVEAAAEIGDGAVGYRFDAGDAAQISALFDSVEAKQGAVSILVNNAGVALPGDFLDLPLEQFQKVIDVNLTGTFVASQRAAKAMVAAGIKGSIVNMSSINAQVAIPSISAYCASKGGIMQLTKASALALAPHGIRVNAVGPGSIDTEMMAGVNANPEAMEMVLSRTPLGRIGEPREIANVVAFLASDKASYVTGETIYVDGGRLGMNYTR